MNTPAPVRACHIHVNPILIAGSKGVSCRIGSSRTNRYTAVIKDGAWREVDDRIAKNPVRFFGMNLKRVGDADWPAAGAISPK